MTIRPEEIKINAEHFIDDGSQIKASITICVWATSHLLKRSIECYCQQDMPSNQWELIVIDDNSPDDVLGAINFAIGKINMRYIRLEHNFGMRGNCASFNLGFTYSRGHIIMESTPETMLTPDSIRVMYEPHLTKPRAFVAMKTYNLIHTDQKLIDTVDWRKSLDEIKKLPDFNSDYTQANASNTHFGTHQTCSIKKEVFLDLTRGFGFPLFGDYGCEDPWYCGLRERQVGDKAIEDVTIMEPMIVHQWHLPFAYFASMGYAPMLNKWYHSMSDYMNCPSGCVPSGGTCTIWDEGKHDKMTQAEKDEWIPRDIDFIETGGYPSIVRR